MKPFATAFVLMVAGILIIGATDAPPKQVNASPAPPDNSAELAALRAENADLRQQLSSPASPVVDTVAAPIPAVASYSPAQQEMLAHSNAIRSLAGKPPQSLDDRLCRAAQEQADYLARTGAFDHYVNGNPRRRAAKHGFPVRDENDIAAVQENLAGGFSSAANVFNGWSKTGHLAAILEDRPLCGFGVAQDRSRWVALYGREPGSDPYTVQAVDPRDIPGINRPMRLDDLIGGLTRIHDKFQLAPGGNINPPVMVNVGSGTRLSQHQFIKSVDLLDSGSVVIELLRYSSYDQPSPPHRSAAPAAALDVGSRQVAAQCGPAGCGTSGNVRAATRPAVRFTSRARGFRLLPRNRK